VVIARGLEPDVLPRIVAGEALGTRFMAPDVPPENRKRWILAGAVNSGHIVVDTGAAAALQHQGRSLLPAGVAAVEGSFDRGDTVSIHSRDVTHLAGGVEIARGIARYPSEDLIRIKGCHSDRIAEILGYTYGNAVVHRNDLILMRDA
jgi:glutamate 5-kinase